MNEQALRRGSPEPAPAEAGGAPMPPVFYDDVVKEILGACWEMRQMARRKGERRASLRGHLRITERQLALWLYDCGMATPDMRLAGEIAKRMLEAV